MSLARKELIDLINRIPEEDIKEVKNFIEFLRIKRKQNEFKDLELASETSLDFWDNEIDDEVWNKVDNGARHLSYLTKYKLCYIQEAIKMQYTLKEIGENINISEVAVADILKRHG
ncbi:MAG: hypothetical protein JG764_1595 [Clostridiales bacterium]|jgi:hypothetical protein|nr:hypothetical protein [Clostridiales bacterium]